MKDLEIRAHQLIEASSDSSGDAEANAAAAAALSLVRVLAGGEAIPGHDKAIIKYLSRSIPPRDWNRLERLQTEGEDVDEDELLEEDADWLIFCERFVGVLRTLDLGKTLGLEAISKPAK